jgi:hypothetical protein
MLHHLKQYIIKKDNENRNIHLELNPTSCGVHQEQKTSPYLPQAEVGLRHIFT